MSSYQMAVLKILKFSVIKSIKKSAGKIEKPGVL